ncbi:GldM family protein [Ferruginibacter sp. SUN002]|uniref:GldM family protein n=1 Tax=Ferruginibacter sp. SUN002 TaxID=2937789 RepID=UPI003D3653A7
MKKIILVAIFFCSIINTQAQTDCGSPAVMLDKMNVFYIGVPNPVTIASGAPWDKTAVSCMGCSLTGTGSNRVVYVTKSGKATITVVANDKAYVYEFRVKEIPSPVFKIGNGSIKMSVEAFKKLQFCRAELANFDFDANFSITNAAVYFSGKNFKKVQKGTINGNSLDTIKTYMDQCTAGSVVVFDEVKVKGPDGNERSIPGACVILY